MKKSRLLVFALALAVVIMGAGYAAWTDDLKINASVNTGQLDVHFVDEGTFDLDEYVTGTVNYQRDGSGNNDLDIANVKLENLYPGAKAKVTLKMENNSTIPVKMNKITDTRSANWDVNGVNFEQIGASLRFYNADGENIEFANTTTYANPWAPTHLEDVELPVGGYATISFSFTAADDIDENATYTFNPTAVFYQFNK